MASPNPLVAELGDTHVLKAGVLRKRSGRMHQWTSRFFVLSDSKISYKLKADAPQFKCSYDLSAGCIVTEVNVESRIQGKRLYSFWIVWPHDKSKDEPHSNNNNNNNNHNGNDSDDELTLSPSRENTADESTHGSLSVSTAQTGKAKDLKQIVESEVMTMKRQRTLVEEQVELHTAADNNVSLGAKVAAVAVGGVVVGALTAGIGLIPYLTVVGITAAAGGGAVAWQWRYRKPLDSRLIMACESMQEAIEWKTAIEAQIQRIEGTLKPSPPSVNSKVIASIFDRDSLGGTWRRVCVCEQMTIYEHVLPYALNSSGSGCPAKCGVFGASSSLIGLSAGCEDAVCGVWTDSAAACERPTDTDEDSLKNAQMTRCRRAQLVIPCHPLNAFLSLMNAGLWPHKGSFKPVRQLNDHADVIGVEMDTPCALYGGAKSVRRRFALSRFWSLDDDGVYLITLNSVQCDEFPCEVQKGSSSSFKPIPFEQSPSIAAVLSISPRSDCSHSSYAHSALADEECLCVVHCQASCANWEKGEQTGFLMSFIKDHLLELQHSVCVGKYFTVAGDELRQELSTVSAHASAASAASVATTLSEKDIAKPFPVESSAPSTRRAKRGVTTTQPGLEDALSFSQSTHSAHPIPIAHAVQAPSPTTIPHSERDVQRESDKEPEPPLMLERSPASSVMGKGRSSSRLGLFNRKKSSTFDEKDKAIVSPTKTESSSSQKDGGGGGVSVIGTVRSQIAATEEELHRLAKTMKKKVIVSPSYVAHSQTRVDKHQVTPTEYSAIQDAQSELQRKLQQLRQRHVALTGETYEQYKAAQRQSLSRYLSVTGKRENSVNNNNNNAQTRAFASPIIEEVAVVGNEKEQEKTNRKARARPAHWVNVHRVAKSKSWIVFLPSLLVSLLQPSFWQRVLHALALEKEEQDDTRGIQWSSAVRDAQAREAALVVLSLFAALLVATHIFADTLSGIFALIKLAF